MKPWFISAVVVAQFLIWRKLHFYFLSSWYVTVVNSINVQAVCVCDWGKGQNGGREQLVHFCIDPPLIFLYHLLFLLFKSHCQCLPCRSKEVVPGKLSTRLILHFSHDSTERSLLPNPHHVLLCTCEESAFVWLFYQECVCTEATSRGGSLTSHIPWYLLSGCY